MISLTFGLFTQVSGSGPLGPLVWIRVGQGPTTLAVGAGGGCLNIFSLVYHFLFFLPLFRRRPDID